MFNYIHKKLKFLIANEEMHELYKRRTLLTTYRNMFHEFPIVVEVLTDMINTSKTANSPIENKSIYNLIAHLHKKYPTQVNKD